MNNASTVLAFLADELVTFDITPKPVQLWIISDRRGYAAVKSGRYTLNKSGQSGKRFVAALRAAMVQS